VQAIASRAIAARSRPLVALLADAAGTIGAALAVELAARSPTSWCSRHRRDRRHTALCLLDACDAGGSLLCSREHNLASLGGARIPASRPGSPASSARGRPSSGGGGAGDAPAGCWRADRERIVSAADAAAARLAPAAKAVAGLLRRWRRALDGEPRRLPPCSAASIDREVARQSIGSSIGPGPR
jgi:hypothetical protein